MASRRKIGILLIVISACLVAGVIFLAPIFLNLDRYRPQVISYFEQNTGKKVEIARLALTFFPQITVHMDGFGVKSPPLFPPSYIVKVARTDAVLAFWPLLRRNVVIKSVVLEDPEINLAAIVNPSSPSLNGQGTWKAGRLRFGAVETTNVNSTFRLESKEIFFTSLNADAYTGKTTGEFSVNLAKRTATFKADARITGINMVQLLAAFQETRGG